MGKSGKLVVVSGPSGVGKTTIVREVARRTGAAFSVSVTTRPRRQDETDGDDYRFVDLARFEEMIARDELLEWAEVFGQYYGTPAGPVRRAIEAGRTVLLDIDVQGGRQVAEKMPEATFVLIVPPSEAELARRLRVRGSEDEEALADRLAKAGAEIDTARSCGAYNHTVVNDDLETAIALIERIINEETDCE